MTMSRRAFLKTAAFLSLGALPFAYGCAGKRAPLPAAHIHEKDLPPEGVKTDEKPAEKPVVEEGKTEGYCKKNYCAKLRPAKDPDGNTLYTEDGNIQIEGLYFPPAKGRNGAAIERYTVFKKNVTIETLTSAETIAIAKTEKDARKIAETRQEALIFAAPMKPVVVMDEETKKDFGGEAEIVKSTEIDLRLLQEELLREVQELSGYTRPIKLPKISQPNGASPK